MNKIFVEISIGELLDKISILEIKKIKIKDSEKLKFINGEYQVLKDGLDKNVKSDEKLEKLFQSLKETKKSNIKLTKDLENLIIQLKEINLKLWDFEDKTRICEKNKDFGQTFIDLSRSVYLNNDKRANIKSKINKILGSNIKEIKQYVNY